MKIKSEKLHFLYAFLIQVGLLLVCMRTHRTCIGLGNELAHSETVRGQLTNPTLGRFIFMLVAFVLFAFLTFFAEKISQKGKIYLPFALGTLAGTFLWQAIGEDAWHFSMDGIYMVQLESIEVLPLAILFLIAFFCLCKKQILGWGVWSMLLSFGTNWMGHYVLECMGVPFKSFIPENIFMICIGCGLGSVLFVLGLIYGLKKGKTVKQRFEMAVLCYFAMALIAFGIMEGF